MTELASQKTLQRAAPHLPLSWYFDPEVAALEQRLLFDRGPGYVGHVQMAPNPGEYRVLDWRSNGAWTLVNNGGRPPPVADPCPPPPALLLQGNRAPPRGPLPSPPRRRSHHRTRKHN